MKRVIHSIAITVLLTFGVMTAAAQEMYPAAIFAFQERGVRSLNVCG